MSTSVPLTPPAIPAGATALTVYLNIGGAYVACPGYFILPPLQVVTMDSNETLDSGATT